MNHGELQDEGDSDIGECRKWREKASRGCRRSVGRIGKREELCKPPLTVKERSN